MVVQGETSSEEHSTFCYPLHSAARSKGYKVQGYEYRVDTLTALDGMALVCPRFGNLM